MIIGRIILYHCVTSMKCAGIIERGLLVPSAPFNSWIPVVGLDDSIHKIK